MQACSASLCGRCFGPKAEQVVRSWEASDLQLFAMVVALVIARAVDQVLYYRIAIGMAGYTWYFSAVILPIGLLMFLAPVTAYRVWASKDITKAMLAFPQRKVAVLAALDTAYNILSSLPIKAVGGTVANVMSQAVLPVNMALSGFVLKYRFKATHYIGAALAVYGVCVRLMPQFMGQDGDSGSAQGGTFVVWMLVLVAAALPNAGSNVAKEVVLKGMDMDEWYLNFVVGVWQLVFGALTVWTVWIPGTEDYVPVSKFGSHVAAASACFLGTPSRPEDDCGSINGGGAPVFTFMAFIFFNVAYNMLMLAIFKRGSSVLFVVASACRLPLVDILLTWKLIAGAALATFTLYDGFALVALIIAITTYNLVPESKPEALEELVAKADLQAARPPSAAKSQDGDGEQLLGIASDVERVYEGSPSGMSLAPMTGHQGSDYGALGDDRGRSRGESV